MNLKNPLSWLSVGFGSGLSPIAPGTVGSFFALIIYYYLFFGNIIEVIDHLIFLFFIVISFFIGLFIYPKTVEGEEDPSSFVWDEFVGMWVACIPLAIIDFPLMWLFISFLLFRIFDIWKPLGIKVLDRKQGAFYVMIDDVLAGMFAAIAVIFLSFFFNLIF
jgi:phosphatidylglycerophosphatase A|tara:strand:- start:12307 stop:12792 length:486 start_codon:yes stop_codon:yes gene_type:complete